MCCVVMQLVPRLLPHFMLDNTPGLQSKFDEPTYLDEGEEMFREKFSENLQMVEDIITQVGSDSPQKKKSSEFTGFKKFLFGSLEALDIDVSDYLGRLSSRPVWSLC